VTTEPANGGAECPALTEDQACNEQACNIPPVADCGDDQNVSLGDTVKLNGSASYDPEGALISYRWACSDPNGANATAVALSDPSAPTPTFPADIEGTYMCTLVVNDGELDSESCDNLINAKRKNVAPNAEGGDDQNVAEGDIVALDGSGSDDPDDYPQPLTYLWSCTNPNGNSVALSDPADPNPTFTAGIYGIYVCGLTVNDGELNDSDTVLIHANGAPNAYAGDDIYVYIGDSATLDGSGSNDPDNWPQPLSYFWTFVSVANGSVLTNADIKDADSVSPGFVPDVDGTYVLELMVSDGLNADYDNVTVEAGIKEPEIINTLVSFNAVASSYKTTTDTSGCPAGFVGKFSFNSTLKNTKNASLYSLIVKVATLTNGNLLQNADGGPGGAGAVMTVPWNGSYSDGELNPGESVVVPFSLCLKSKSAFSFFVDILGIVE
jgi:hypothetical protein